MVDITECNVSESTSDVLVISTGEKHISTDEKCCFFTYKHTYVMKASIFCIIPKTCFTSRLRALIDLEGQLQVQQSEVQSLREMKDLQGEEENLLQDLEMQWEETQRAFFDR